MSLKATVPKTDRAVLEAGSLQQPAVDSNGSSPAPPVNRVRDQLEARPRHVVRYLKMCRAHDTVAGPILLLAVFVVINFQPTLSGLQEFLGLRVTVRNLLYVTAFAILWRLVCTVWRLYDWRQVREPRRELLRVAGACASGSGVALAFPALSVTGAFGMEAVAVFFAASILTLSVTRRLLRWLVLEGGKTLRQVLIVGTGSRAQGLFRALQMDPDSRVAVIGFVDSDPLGELPPGGEYLGSLSALETILVGRVVDEVLIALPMRSRYEEVQQALQICERVGVRAKFLPDIFRHSRAQYRLESADPVPGIAMVMAPDDSRVLLKRGVDIVLGASALVVLSPIMMVAALAIKLTSPGPVLFVQPRYGLNRRRFNMLKFRTMVDQADSLQPTLEHLNEAGGPTFKIRNDPRITPLGRFLRHTSIDELPQLLHVIRGDMSLVGPRPLPERDVRRFTDASLMRRFSVRPGLTCLWQINGRSDVTFDDWFALDLKYIDEWSLALDFRILLQTIPVVLRGRGAV